MREMTHLRRQSQFPSLCFSSFFQLHLPFPLTGGYECRFSAPRPFRREPDSARLSPFALSSECSYFTPFFLASAPRSRSGRWGFYGLRLFVRFSSISGLRRRRRGVPNRLATSSHDPATLAHLRDGRDQRPGGLPPGPQAALPLIMREMAHLRFHDALSLFIPLLSRSGRLMDSQAASVRTLITPPSSLSPRR